MSQSNDSRIEARECLRRANCRDDSQNRWVWLVLSESWLLLAETQEIAKKTIEANKIELAFTQGAANTTQYRLPALSYLYYEAGI